MTDRPNFDEYIMDIAQLAAARSTCDRARVGCVLVQDRYIIAAGYNGAPSGMPHCDDYGHKMVDGHCIRTIHAEQNAVAQAAMHGAPTKGATAYVTHLPCISCAKLLIAAGIATVVYAAGYGDGDSAKMLTAAGVFVCKL